MTPTEILRNNSGYMLANIGKTHLPSYYSDLFTRIGIRILKTVDGEWEGVPESTLVCLIPAWIDIRTLCIDLRQEAIAVVYMDDKNQVVPDLIFHPNFVKKYEFSWDLFKY